MDLTRQGPDLFFLVFQIEDFEEEDHRVFTYDSESGIRKVPGFMKRKEGHTF
jgi:hypothetical protein